MTKRKALSLVVLEGLLLAGVGASAFCEGEAVETEAAAPAAPIPTVGGELKPLETNLDVELPAALGAADQVSAPTAELEQTVAPAASVLIEPAAPADGAIAVVSGKTKGREGVVATARGRSLAPAGANGSKSLQARKNVERAFVLASAISEIMRHYQDKVDILKNFSADARYYMRDVNSRTGAVQRPADQFVPIAARLSQAMEELSLHYDHLQKPLKASTNGGALEHKIVGGAYRIEKINPADLGDLKHYLNLSSLLDSTEVHVAMLEDAIRTDLAVADRLAREIYRDYHRTVTTEKTDQKFVTTVTHPWYLLFFPREKSNWEVTGSHLEKENKPPFNLADHLLEKLREYYESPLPEAVVVRR